MAILTTSRGERILIPRGAYRLKEPINLDTMSAQEIVEMLRRGKIDGTGPKPGCAIADALVIRAER